MGKLKNISSALSRYQASKGFGIHSPFAFNFILNVLDEKYGYYAYEYLQHLRTKVIERTRSEHGYTPRVISLSEAAAIFRIANHYNPPLFLSIGSSYGVAVASLLSVSRRSRIIIYETIDNSTAREVLAEYADRIDNADSLQEAIDKYNTERRDADNCFVTINNVSDNDVQAVEDLIDKLVTECGILIIRNTGTSRTMKRLWEHCKGCMKYGMSFSNGKMVVAILNPKLPRQDFGIWLS